MARDGEKAPTVLVIDDDRGIRSLLTVALSDAGWAVTEASNGYSGLRRAEQDAPDLILLDIALPELDGIAVLDELRRRPETRAVPVVAVTGYPERLAERRDSVSGVLSKPFELEQVVGLAAMVLGRARRPASPIPPAVTGLHERAGLVAPRTVGASLTERT